jgi:hypothetical protein
MPDYLITDRPLSISRNPVIDRFDDGNSDGRDQNQNTL